MERVRQDLRHPLRDPCRGLPRTPTVLRTRAQRRPARPTLLGPGSLGLAVVALPTGGRGAARKVDRTNSLAVGVRRHGWRTRRTVDAPSGAGWRASIRLTYGLGSTAYCPYRRRAYEAGPGVDRTMGSARTLPRKCLAMSNCSKIAYPTPRAAGRALLQIQNAKRASGLPAPVAVHPCPTCLQWHVTSRPAAGKRSQQWQALAGLR